VAVNSSGTVYLTDTGNKRVLKLPVGSTTHQSGHISVTDPVEEAETGWGSGPGWWGRKPQFFCGAQLA